MVNAACSVPILRMHCLPVRKLLVLILRFSANGFQSHPGVNLLVNMRQKYKEQFMRFVMS